MFAVTIVNGEQLFFTKATKASKVTRNREVSPLFSKFQLPISNYMEKPLNYQFTELITSLYFNT
jgi:hypothetical protein